MGDKKQIDQSPLPKAYWGQIVAMLTTALVLGYLSWTGYHDAINKAEATSSGVARVNAFALDTTLNTVDMLLAESAVLLAPLIDKPAALQKTWQAEAPRLRHYLARIPQVDSIRIFDASGELRLTTATMLRPMNVADRPHFQRVRDDPDAGLVISDVVVSRSTNRNAVILLRAIRDPQGRFLGAVSAPLDLSYFDRLLEDARLGTDGAAGIRRIDTGTLVTRRPYVPGAINKSEPAHPAHQLILEGRKSGTLSSASPFDGIQRATSFQRLEHFPLYVVVGVSHAEMLREWRARAAASAALVALALLSVFLFYRRMARSNRLLQGVLDAASEVAIISTDSKGLITVFNRGAENLLGYTAAETIGKLRLDHFQPPDKPGAPITAHNPATADQHERSWLRKDHSLVHVAEIVTPITSGRQRAVGYLCVAHDVGKQKRVAGLQAAQNRILEMIASGAPLPLVLDQLVRGLESQAQGMLCSVLLFDALSGTLRHGAAPSLPDAYNRAMDGLPIGTDRNADARGAFLHDTVLIDDIQTDPRWACLHDAARSARLHACWSSPIIDAGGGLLGTFALYSTGPALQIDTAEQLVDMATHTAAIGIASAHSAAALEESEKRMRLALHAANMFAYEYITGSDRVYRNGNLPRTWGLPPEGTGKAYFKLVHPDDEKHFLAALAGLTPDAPEYAIEYRLSHPNGTYIWVADWASATFDDSGRIDRVFGVCRNVTERKALENELSRHRQHLEQLVAERTAQLSSSEASIRLILESTADGVYGVDTHGRVTFINPAACRMLGLATDQVVGKHIHALIHHSHPDGQPYSPLDCPTNQTLRLGEVVTISDEVYWHADGHAVPVIYSTHPMIRDGNIVGAVISFMDVTERRALEEAREQARHAAEKLARVKSEFLANMSHEIRTSLNGILGFAAIGHRDSAEPRTRQVFAHILDSGKLLLGVVNDILDFSKIEAGKLHLESVATNLPGLLKATAGAFSERASSKGLTLRLELAPNLPVACTLDPLRVSQILANLLSNALKFTEAGSVTIHAARNDDQLVFRISDTGIGIDPARLNQIFLAFEQADSSTTRRFGGTGLGLAITRRLVALFEGSIEASSEPGHGSCFEVRLPYVPAENASLPAPHAITASPQAERLAGISILAAEDNEVNQLVLEDMLLSEGARLEMVGNGRAALERVAASRPGTFDIVLMDIQMPEMDGYEATRRIHLLAPALPVIGQTAHAMAEEKAKCMDAGMAEHIAKPIDLDTLVASILRHTRPPA